MKVFGNLIKALLLVVAVIVGLSIAVFDTWKEIQFWKGCMKSEETEPTMYCVYYSTENDKLSYLVDAVNEMPKPLPCSVEKDVSVDPEGNNLPEASAIYNFFRSGKMIGSYVGSIEDFMGEYYQGQMDDNMRTQLINEMYDFAEHPGVPRIDSIEIIHVLSQKEY